MITNSDPIAEMINMFALFFLFCFFFFIHVIYKQTEMFCVAALKSPAAFHGQIRSLERARVSCKCGLEKHSWVDMLLNAAEKNRP